MAEKPGGLAVSYVKFLQDTAQRTGSILCLGLDPVIEKIPVQEKDTEKKISRFCIDIIEAVREHIGAVKPNLAFYQQYGMEGLRALASVTEAAKKAKLPVILDAKMGDTGRSSEAYARAAFEVWKADAVTVSPYMGRDSISPFTGYCKEGKGVYVLCRTSNPGAEDVQNLRMESGFPVFAEVAGLISSDWYAEGIGAVVGATAARELEQLSVEFARSGKVIPFLIPGVGRQGGSAREVAGILRKTGNQAGVHRINVSSGIIYAFEGSGSKDYAKSALDKVEQLNDEIRWQN